MSRLTRDGTAEPVSFRETKFSGANEDRGSFTFSVQLTTSRNGHLTRLIHTLAIGGGLTAADLQRAMMNLSGMAARPQQPPTRLTDVVNADAIEASGFLEDANVQQALVPLLADEQQTEQELRETLRSPQLQQALAALSQALQTENFNNIMSSFELDPSNPKSAEAMGKGDAVAAFLQALIHAAEAKREQETAEASDNLPQSGQEDDAMDSDQ